MNYNKTEIIKLIGISKTPIFSIGSINLKIIEQNIEFEHKFHIVSDDFMIPANGIIGKGFLKQFKCLIDYGEMNLKLRKHNFNSVTVPIKSELIKGVSAVPPRSKTFKIFHIKSETFPCLVEAQEIDDGIVIPTTLIHEPNAWIRVLNSTEDMKIINTGKIKTSSITDFHIIQSQKRESNINS